MAATSLFGADERQVLRDADLDELALGGVLVRAYLSTGSLPALDVQPRHVADLRVRALFELVRLRPDEDIEVIVEGLEKTMDLGTISWSRFLVLLRDVAGTGALVHQDAARVLRNARRRAIGKYARQLVENPDDDLALEMLGRIARAPA